MFNKYNIKKMSTPESVNWDNKTQILQFVSLIIANKIFKYDFASGTSDSFIIRMIYNACLTVIIGLGFLSMASDYLENIKFENISGLFFSYWISINITDKLYRIDNQQEKISNVCKEITLNIIIFAGLTTIYNIMIK